MKPQLLKVSKGPAQSFSMRQDLVPHFNNKWHYHAEVELIHFKKGEGTQFIGDSIKQFKHGDIILIGTQLPHYWRFDESYFKEDPKHSADVRVTHFSENFWGDQFLQLPENKMLKSVLDKAKRGIMVNGKTKAVVAGIMERMLQAEGVERIILLMEALNVIANCNKVTLLSSIGFSHNASTSADNDRINAIYEYSIANFRNKIHLEEIAAIAYVSPNSFCRYFKSHTQKTYSQFLIELKVGHACKLLIENKVIIKQLCYESGFNNFASFHKFFKQITGKSPLCYQREFMRQSA
ncbi:AraC family transcriptional regulator [Mucilaginibacter sp. HMF5004]|uniref:AraC family transcriptional regulator n=1 Tax=Mucilaginibacter rivuli TaxID=2857527 RepID=UPI001C5E2F11|nr:AraC family transcriptional regulator [Mucilaginibacter rivuli]MBW4889234.1 AraC family transcriptional regulator [Mucilaginibacter rivuli]